MPFLAYKVGATQQSPGENMRKFWRIGLILVIGLSACGDKKAEQAKTLQQEMQDMLAKAAAQQQDVQLWRRHGDAGRRRLRGHRRQGGGHDFPRSAPSMSARSPSR